MGEIWGPKILYKGIVFQATIFHISKCVLLLVWRASILLKKTLTQSNRLKDKKCENRYDRYVSSFPGCYSGNEVAVIFSFKLMAVYSGLTNFKFMNSLKITVNKFSSTWFCFLRFCYFVLFVCLSCYLFYLIPVSVGYLSSLGVCRLRCRM